MNNRHRATLSAVFRSPVSGTLDWSDIEGLLLAAGARLIEGTVRGCVLRRMVKSRHFIVPILPKRQNAIRSALPGHFWNVLEFRHEQCHELQKLFGPH